MRTAEGQRTVEVPNPVGDAAHHPLDEGAVADLLGAWLGDRALVQRLGEVATALPHCRDVAPLLRGLA